MTEHDRPLATPQDVMMWAWLTALLPLSWLAPQRLWTRLSKRIGVLMMKLSPRRTSHRVEMVRQLCADHRGLPAPRVIVAMGTAARVEQHLQYLRELRPGGWEPRIDVTGREHIDRALASGHGCIVWVAPMVHAPLVVKKGLHAAGYSVTHLSHADHGLPGSRLGRLASPIWTSAERRYVRERVVMTDGTELKRTRHLYRRLGQNAVVSITGGVDRGVRVVSGPILAGTRRMATGAPSIALASGAALLPVFLRKHASDHFEIIVEPAMVASSASHRHEAVDELVHCYLDRIEHHLRERPGLYLQWW